MVAARHPEVAQDELREEGQVEADEDHDAAESLAQPSGYMRPVIFGHQ